MSDPATKWTKQQREAIETVGKNLLVSAAAGSGKTSVLAERCAHLICDAPAPHRCEVNELLVVTFTEAAAAEMRARIARALSDRYEKSADERLARQLALIDRAQISTLHAFCLAVLKAHFHLLELDPSFSIISEEEGLLMRSEVVRQLFDDRYAADESGAFQRFVDRYGDGNDSSLRYRVVHTHALLMSLVKPDEWVAKTRERLDAAASRASVADSYYGKALTKLLKGILNDLYQRCASAAAQFDEYPELDGQKDFAGDVLAAIEVWQHALDAGGFDGLAQAVRDQPKIDMPALRKPSPEAKAVRDQVQAVRDELDKGQVRGLARFSSDEWREGMKTIVEPANVLLDLVKEFGDRYERAKRELRVLDFSDLERLALKVLQDKDGNPTAAARAYRDQFKHVLVDEYQDINELQDAILSLVCADHRMFCVGDVKQSIYRFRLAEPRRFMQRDKEYRAKNTLGAVIDLQTNFRSRGPLLATLNGVFRRLMTREAAEIVYDESHFLYPPEQSPYDTSPVDGPHVELHVLPRDTSPAESESDASGDEAADELDRTEREAAFVAMQINKLVRDDPIRVLAKNPDTGEIESRPIKFGDVAILLRSMRFKSEQFATMLRRAGIPVHSDSATGFFESMEVRDVLALLKVLDNPLQDIPLAAVLRSPIASIPEPEDALARIRLAYPNRAEVTFHEAVPRYAREQDDELAARLRDLLNQIQEWREMAHRRPLAEVLWTIYDGSGYLAFCEGLADGEQRVANLLSLHERAGQFGAFRRQGLGRFMRFLDSLREESDLGQPSVASEAEDVVRIMSVHRSKGLEFPVVFVPDLGKAHNLSDSRGHILVDRQTGIGMSVCDDERRVRYPSLASVVVGEHVRRQLLAEEMRVLYVATTRAREKLVLVGTCNKGSPEELRDAWQRRWAGHEGPLPPAAVLGGSCMLDWLGPTWAASSTQSGRKSAPHGIELVLHDARDVSTDKLAPNVREREPSARQQALGTLAPLKPAPKADATADDVWGRLLKPYAYRALTEARAVNSVTSLSKSAADDPHEYHARRATEQDRIDGFIAARGETLRTPRAGEAALGPSAADVGAATHVLLERLDFSQPISRADIEAKRQQLIDGRQLPEASARQIDVGTVEWFVGSELGHLLRQHASIIRRELSISFPMDVPDQPPAKDPMDRVMIRGRLDLFVPIESGAVLIDFKTDRVTEDREIDERMKGYAEQLRHYAAAMKRITGREVARACVVFLNARVVREVELSAKA